MKYIQQILKPVLIALSGVLCTILILKLLYLLRLILPWRVNCWFCNSNFWLKITSRNSWTCPKCEQYNGFTKDGDYNKPLLTGSDKNVKTPKVLRSPRNGLCKMCNINQQLKVVQLANFVTMDERNYEEEVEAYREQLEKAYKLCTGCKKVLQMKLYKEKESLLGTKLLETRSPQKKAQKQLEQNQTIQNMINKMSKYVAIIILLLVTIECYKHLMKNPKISQTVTNVAQIITTLLERVLTILKMKLVMTFPQLEVYFDHVNILYKDWSNDFDLNIEDTDQTILLTQEVLGGFVCCIQIIGHFWSMKLNYMIIIDILWTVFVVSSLLHYYVAADQLTVSLLKLTTIAAILLLFSNMKPRVTKTTRTSNAPKGMKNLSNRSKNSFIDDDDELETDDDVSLSKFGLHNSSESSNDNSHLHSLINGRSFTPRNNDSIWSKPKLNSTFCVNSALSKSTSSANETLFTKPVFKKYQNLSKDSDSDSDLDESISSLCISSPKKSKQNGGIFSLRKFNATPNFAVPTPLNRRPLISPSKLGHSTSWVAGGYWGSDDRQVFSIDGSRSSSQSSGFESQSSSVNRNVFSHPSSREESVCGESERTILDRFSNCSMRQNQNSHSGMNHVTHINHPQNSHSGMNHVTHMNHPQNGHSGMNHVAHTSHPQNFSRVNSPVYPQMQYNGHVHIPQARMATASHFAQQYVRSRLKPAGGSGLIKLPQVNPFQSR